MTRWLTLGGLVGVLCLPVTSVHAQAGAPGQAPGLAQVQSQGQMPGLAQGQMPVPAFGAYGACASPWEFQAGAVALHRSQPRDLVLVQDGASATLLNSNQFDFTYQAGPEAGVIYHGRVVDIEFRWFQVHDWLESTPTTTSATGVTAKFLTDLNLPGSVDLGARYLSELSNFELNARRRVNSWLTLLAGFRYLELDERLDMNVASILGSGSVTTQSFNSMFGCQIGAEAKVWDNGGPFQMTVFTKAGGYDNDIGTRASNSLTTTSSEASTNHVSFLGEVGVQAFCQIDTHWSAQIGYQASWLAGVATASSQVPHLDPTGVVAGTVATGDCILYHGLNGSMQYRW